MKRSIGRASSGDEYVKHRFPFIRRASVRYEPASPMPEPAEETPPTTIPGFDLKTQMKIPQVADVPNNKPKTAYVEGLTPLPRCGRCGTAVAFSQVVCHGCGSGLRRL